MDDINVVIAGISSYIDNEFTNKINGLPKWAVGVGSGLMLDNANNIFNKLKDNPMIVALGIINENKINTDLLYKEFKKQAQKGAVTTNIPMIGAVTFNEEDVEKVYNNIKMKRGV